ncbi:MAG: ImmA/IrrE family metallo-endopeptidase [Deltaproteobacteria bacterium]|nr:ImmA/IrrE family metallo-endopeptidase [Deltaproteobacteria bacterium]
MQHIKVPWLNKKAIAEAASTVLADYEEKIKRRVEPPIPVENIIERGLSLRLGYTDLRKKLKLDDVLGATYVNEKMICVDRSLAENRNEGRLCFTFAHEAGHWVLHRSLVDQACRTGSGGGLIFCRIKDAKKPIEWQADYFASCMLLPEETVRVAFCKCFGPRSLVLYNVKSAYSGPVCFDPSVETWPQIADAVREAGGFSNVSKQSMIIRLQDLGLVINETRTKLSWKESYAMA